MTFGKIDEEAKRRAEAVAPAPQYYWGTAAVISGFVAALVAMLALSIAGVEEQGGAVYSTAILIGGAVGLYYWSQHRKHEAALLRAYEQINAELDDDDEL